MVGPSRQGGVGVGLVGAGQCTVELGWARGVFLFFPSHRGDPRLSLSLGALLGERAKDRERESESKRARERARERGRGGGGRGGRGSRGGGSSEGVFSFSGCCWAASGISSEIFSGDRRPSCNPALPTHAYQGIARPPFGTIPITPGTFHLYPPTLLTPFASA